MISTIGNLGYDRLRTAWLAVITGSAYSPP